MKTNNNISDNRRGKASISSLNRIKKVVKWVAILITSIIGLVLWVFLRPIFRGVGWLSQPFQHSLSSIGYSPYKNYDYGYNVEIK